MKEVSSGSVRLEMNNQGKECRNGRLDPNLPQITQIYPPPSLTPSPLLCPSKDAQFSYRKKFLKYENSLLKQVKNAPNWRPVEGSKSAK